MHRSKLTLPLFAVVAIVLAAGNLGAQSACRAADNRSDQMVVALRRLTSPDTAVAATRLRLPLPAVNPDSVQVVTNDSVCARMAAVYSAAISLPRPNNATPSGQVYVVKVGDVYVVMDPAVRKGEWFVQMVINSSGTILARYGHLGGGPRQAGAMCSGKSSGPLPQWPAAMRRRQWLMP